VEEGKRKEVGRFFGLKRSGPQKGEKEGKGRMLK